MTTLVSISPTISAAEPGRAAVRLSPSQVNTLNDCPAKWYYKHALKLPDPPSAGLAIGRAVHAGIAGVWADNAAHAFAMFEAEWNRAIGEVRPPLTAAEHQAAKERAGTYLEIWIREALPTIGEGDGEMELTGHINGVPVLCRADILTENGSCIEVKTRKEKPRTLPTSYYLQAITGAMLANCEHARVDVLCGTKAPGLQTYSIRLTPDAVKFAEVSYAMANEQINSGIFPPRRESPLCTRDCCPYFMKCIADHGGEVRP